MSLLSEFINTDFFATHPQFKTTVSLIITGSVCLGEYDEFSDIDVEFSFADESIRPELDLIVKDYKKTLKQRMIPIQFHSNKTFDEIQKHHITGWKNDDSLREYATALIVCDPKKQFRTFQKKIKWYPRNILKEKLSWLYAEAVFTIVDRFSIAKKRGDVYYGDVMKLHIMRLLGNAILMLEKEYPSFDKHLQKRLKRIPGAKKFLTEFNGLLNQTDFAKTEKGLIQLLKIVEEKLIIAKFTTKKDEQYWVDLRPTEQVTILSR